MISQILFDLESEVIETRRAALRLLVQSTAVSQEEKSAVLKEFSLKETDPELRALFRKYLDICSGTSALISVRKEFDHTVLRTGSSAEKIEFLKTVMDHKASVSIVLLKTLLSEESDVFVLATLISTIGKTGSDSDAAALVKFLTHQDARVRANAVDAIGRLGDTSVFDQLVPLLKDLDGRVKANAARVFSASGLGRTLEIFQKMVQSGKVQQLQSAIYALEHIRDQRAVELLQTAEQKLRELMKSDDFFEFDFHDEIDVFDDSSLFIPLDSRICQNCSHANAPEAEKCLKCGMKLL